MTAVAPERPADAARVTVIAPVRGAAAHGLRELAEYRELLYFLVWRDLKVRYKQTALGVAWAVIQPFTTMVVFSVVFGALAKVPSDGVPYPVFSFAALVPWGFFATGLTTAANSLVGSATLIRKVYFPRLVIPVATVLAGVVDLGIALAMLLAMMGWYGIVPTAAIVWLPALVLLALVTALGTGCWLSALNVRYRDVKYAVPFLVQLWMYATPVAYPSTLLPAGWRALYALNPMVGVVEGFRWALLGTDTRPGPVLLVSATSALLLLASGVRYFRRMERTFADLV